MIDRQMSDRKSQLTNGNKKTEVPFVHGVSAQCWYAGGYHHLSLTLLPSLATPSLWPCIREHLVPSLTFLSCQAVLGKELELQEPSLSCSHQAQGDQIPAFNNILVYQTQPWPHPTMIVVLGATKRLGKDAERCRKRSGITSRQTQVSPLG